jgi:formiminoglutamase
MSEDAKWPRAASLISKDPSPVGLIDIPAHQTSISPTNAHLTPAAIREALKRYSTFSYTTNQDLSQISIEDLGAIQDPDENEQETQRTISQAGKKLTIALGGDNSITYAAALGVFNGDLTNAGLITLDAHHDLRDGISNGSPVRRLIEAGLSPENIVQIGINDFSNSASYAQLAKDLGITVITRTQVGEIGIAASCKLALEKMPGRVFVDFDVDVCDRSVVPGCPASAPGGLSAYELRQAARILISDARVLGLDITEIDASKDAEDQRTVRLGALVVLEGLAGYLAR